MHRKLLFILTMFAMVIGSASQAQAAAGRASSPQPGSSAWSNVVSIPARSATPAPPSGLAAKLSGSSVSLTWKNNAIPPSAATVIWVQRGTTTGFANYVDYSVASTATSYTDTTVVAGTTYYYRVLAQNQAWQFCLVERRVDRVHDGADGAEWPRCHARRVGSVADVDQQRHHPGSGDGDMGSEGNHHRIRQLC